MEFLGNFLSYGIKRHSIFLNLKEREIGESLQYVADVNVSVVYVEEHIRSNENSPFLELIQHLFHKLELFWAR